MKVLKYFGVLSLGVLLAACSSFGAGNKYSSKDYAKHAESVPPIKVPNGANAPKLQAYYKVPAMQIHPGQKPSLVPPGSKVLQYEKTAQAPKTAQQHKVWAAWGRDSDSLILPIKAASAWSKVGTALRQTPYQILDQDNGLGAYYVLDTTRTGDKITSTTPIYRVNVTAMGATKTKVVVLNKGNQPANAVIAKRILTALQKNIT